MPAPKNQSTRSHTDRTTENSVQPATRFSFQTETTEFG